MRISAKQHRQFATRMEMARTASESALKQLRTLFDSFIAVPDFATSEDVISRARFEGWLDALQAIGHSAALDGHDELRTMLLDEIAAKSMEQPSTADAVDPADGIVAPGSTRVEDSYSSSVGLLPPSQEKEP